jgi:electron transport complex protein RnfC
VISISSMSILLDILGPRHSFEGGLFLPDYKSVTARQPIQTLATRSPLHVPLTLRGDLPTECIVREGQRVLRHQRLSSPLTEDAVPVHAPTSGVITKISPVQTVCDGLLPGVMIEPDGSSEAAPNDPRWQSDSIVVQLSETGVACPLPRAPAASILRQAMHTGVSDLIINAMETEPYLTADLRTLVEETGRLMDTACEFADALGVSRVLFAAPYRHSRLIKRLEGEAIGRHVEIAALAHKYPQCHPHVLIKTLLDREVPPGGGPLDVETLVLPLAMIRNSAEALWRCRPVSDVVMTVAGDAVERPGTYRVPIGTSLKQVAHAAGADRARVSIWGGPLTGVSVESDSAVVTADTIALLLFNRIHELSTTPCIHCGWCVEDCPVGIDPVWLTSSEATAALTYREELHACIDCGLCTYVCPSQLPLAAEIRQARDSA